MKFSSVAAITMAFTGINAHTIMQKISVAGAEKGSGTGIRLPTSNNPIQDVNSANIACNANSGNTAQVIDIPAGSKVGGWWGHVIGGAQMAGDPDNPIAKSHKGPVIVYLAKVSNAANAATSGLQWFKVAEDGLDSSGKWGVDRMISQGGWTYFNMPTCVTPGQYLMRIEAIALHSAKNQGGAQFYMSCVQINLTGSGSKTGTTVSFPGAYKATDPGILINIYDATGQPNGGGRPYTIPGPAVMQC